MNHVAVEKLRGAGKLLCAFAAVLGLSAGWTAGAAAQGMTKIRVGTLPIISQLQLFTALDKGYFKEAGLDVEVSTFRGGAPMIQALNVGAIDIAGAVNIGSYLAAVAQGFDDVVIAGDSPTGTDPHSGVTLLTVRKDSGINSLKDLAGKRIGLPNLRSLNWAYQMEYLTRNGVDTSKIHWIETGTPGGPAALLTRQVDAVDLVQPFVAVAMMSGEVKTLYNEFAIVAPGGLISVQAAQRKWAEAHADVVKRYVDALKRALDYNMAHQQEARERLTRHTKIDIKLANAIPYSTTIEKLFIEPKDLQVPMDLSIKYGLLKKPLPVDLLVFESARAR